MKKKFFSALLAALLLISLAVPVFASSRYTTDSVSLHGRDYTSVPALAAALDRVFAGSPDMYSDMRCTTAAAAPIGSRNVPPGRTYYVKSPTGSVYSGTSCYIYANAVYATLFGDIPYHGEDVSWRHSYTAARNLSKGSYEEFSRFGIGFGALLRTTSNADGSYNGNSGHSIIILKYDRDGITYLEGNGDGNGIIRVTNRSWDTFNSVSVSGRGYRISFIVQPTPAYISSLTNGSGEWEPGELVGYLARVKSYDWRFRDVGPLEWFADEVAAAYELGFMDGRDRVTFSPDGKMTAAEAVTLCARFLSLYYADGTDFSSAGTWYSGYYAYLRKWGIDTSFASPDEPVTRGDFAVLMARALPEEARGGDRQVTFPDVPAKYASAVNGLARCGVVTGAGGYFWPDGTLTRAEAAAFLGRMADKSLRAG